MRWLSFYRNQKLTFGYITSDGSGVVDVGERSDFSDLRQVLESTDLATLAGKCGDSADLSMEDVEYAPTITNPKKILCVGLNYKAHQEETGRGGEGFPTIFVRFAAAQVAHSKPMVRPKESQAFDFEGEIAMIIGSNGRRISQSEALSHVAGFGIYNDGSIRDYQRHTSQFTPGKNFADTGAFGPWMMTPDEIGDLSQMEITTRLNGEVMQNAKAELLVHGFEELIEYCSTFVELEAGDVIVTGTPGGVGVARKPPVFMDEGDLIEIEVKPIGTLSNSVMREK